MAWSTRQLAELTGTTVNTVRHYHRLGLLDEPERRQNGYKQYGIQELLELLRIRRLVELRVPLARIAEAGPDGGLPPETLRKVDTGLVAEIERLIRIRSCIAAILRDGATADTPAGSEPAAAQVSSSDAVLVRADFDGLSPDAGEETRQNLAEKIAPVLTQHLLDYPRLSDPAARAHKSEEATRKTFMDEVTGLHNSAQLDVIGRASVLAQEQLRHAHNH